VTVDEFDFQNTSEKHLQGECDKVNNALKKRRQRLHPKATNEACKD
jgi:hypothetical protein